jgi:O-antigen/teichoic acid export membrane protein
VPGHPGADTAFALLAFPMFGNGIILFCFYVFLAHRKWRHLMMSFGAGVVLTVILNLLWTAPYGFVGAASALIVVHVLLIILLLPQALRLAPIRFTRIHALQWLAFSLVMAGTLVLLSPLATSVTRIVLWGGMIGLGMLVLLWLLGTKKAFWA